MSFAAAVLAAEDKIMNVVFGATGRTGGEAARALLDRGEPVRVVVRRPEQGAPWKALGAQVAVATLDDVDAVFGALAGASSAFLLNPTPSTGDPYAHAAAVGASLAGAVRRAALPKVVVLSSIGAQHASGTGVVGTLHQIEALLTGAADATAFLRPGYFIETWSEVATAAITAGVLPTFIEPGRRMPMVSTVDVGRAAAALMGETWTGTRVVELGGPTEWSPRDVATAFAEVLGRPVQPLFVTPDERQAALAEAGIAGPLATALMGMYEGIANGMLDRQDGAELRRGRTSLRTAIERVVAEASVAAWRPWAGKARNVDAIAKLARLAARASPSRPPDARDEPGVRPSEIP